MLKNTVTGYIRLQDGRWLVYGAIKGSVKGLQEYFSIAEKAGFNEEGIFHTEKFCKGCSCITKIETLHKYGVTDEDVRKVKELAH